MENEIEKFVKNRGILNLYHFTPLPNVVNILEHGLLTRKYMEEKGFPFKPSDSDRYDGRLDTVSCSISWPNYDMLRRKINQDDPYVIVRLAPDILWNFRCLFFPANAARSQYSAKTNSDENFIGLEALKKLFDQQVKTSGYNCYECNRAENVQKRFTTDVQAEVMVCGNIPIEYVVDINCASDDNKLKLWNLLEKDSKKRSKVITNHVFFEPRQC